MTPISQLLAEDVAKWMLVGFQRSWFFGEIYDALDTEVKPSAMNERFPFFPMATLRTPVRAEIMGQWPKLAEYLNRNNDNPERLIAAIPQLIRLKSKRVFKYSINSDESKELSRTAKQYRRARNTQKIGDDIQRSTERNAWNVCKGKNR